jgi:small redox-active disulfide protein 2
MNIKVLGPGCANCKTLHQRTLTAVEELKIEATVEKVEDYQKIASYGIMRTPALVIEEHVVSSGSVPKVEELKALIAGQKQ